MKELKFVRCKETKNVLELVYVETEDKLAELEGFQVLKANSTDAAGEKHVPEVKVDGKNVHVVVGSVKHPMTEEHLVSFIVLQTDKRVMRVDLTADMEPEATFVLADGEKAVCVYEYCNLHGLWKAEV